MSNFTKDIAIQSLLSSVKEVAPDVSEDLIEQIYAIEKHNQFNGDEEARFKAIKALIDRYIDDQIG
jgi:hypothetical protein